MDSFKLVCAFNVGFVTWCTGKHPILDKQMSLTGAREWDTTLGHSTQTIERWKRKTPSGIWTHDVLIMKRVLYHWMQQPQSSPNAINKNKPDKKCSDENLVGQRIQKAAKHWSLARKSSCDPTVQLNSIESNSMDVFWVWMNYGWLWLKMTTTKMPYWQENFTFKLL